VESQCLKIDFVKQAEEIFKIREKENRSIEKKTTTTTAAVKKKNLTLDMIVVTRIASLPKFK
jgi:hypothetical protein